MNDLHSLSHAIIHGDRDTAISLTEQAVSSGIDPRELISAYLIPAMDEVGKRFESHEYFVPELLLSARAMKGALELINPILADQGTKPLGSVVIGTVKGDLHDIGKNLVASMLEGAGYAIIDLGIDVSPEKFVETVQEKEPDVVALSALLTTTMPSMATTIDLLKSTGVRNNVKVIIGGAPVSQKYADDIGADGYSGSASGAVNLVRTCMGHN